MQRKKTRGYYSETVELGTHLLPVAQMRKFKMKISNVIKYVIFFIIAYIICSVYQKVGKTFSNWYSIVDGIEILL